MKADKMQPESINSVTGTTVATVASYGSSGGLILAGLTLNDISLIFGMTLALLTFCINW
jgi:hypothetical protein